MVEGCRLSASFRDPSGFVFRQGGEIYRQVNRSYAGPYSRLMGSGLYDGLTGAGTLISHDEVDVEPLEPATAHKVLRPERIPFISYPYEWSFSQLQDAALLTLSMQRRALEACMTLKDCSAYNVQFKGGRPVFIDTLSFDEYVEGEPWVAYRQFCQHFLAPLALMAMTDVRLNQLFRTNIDGVPLDLAVRLLPWRSQMKPSLLLHIHLHARAQSRYTEAPSTARTSRRRKPEFSRKSLLGLVESLEGAVRALRWKPSKTVWLDYYETTSYTDASLERKRAGVARYLDRIRPASVWDLGANTGWFSRLAADRGVPTVAFDLDPACVEVNYLEVKRKSDANVLPLCLDLFNPSPSLGWRNRERMSLMERGPVDAVLALALVHHLAIAGGLPMIMVAEFLRQIGRWLVVEFVPPDDPQARRLLAARTATHEDHDQRAFERAFREHFDIEDFESIGEVGRVLYLMRARNAS
jgi:ribosomal protein L11 methylase PrmA